jgi:hypothetical protein
MRLPAPVFGAVQSAKYREIHSQLPTLMRVFLWCSEASAALLVALGVAVFFPQIGMMIWWGYPFFGAFFPAYNVFVPLGFRLFSWLVAQS